MPLDDCERQEGEPVVVRENESEYLRPSFLRLREGLVFDKWLQEYARKVNEAFARGEKERRVR